MSPAIDALQELVDDPNETLEVEYKTWLDLSDPETRADLARHIAALANHGGGKLVIGFDDDTMNCSGPSPFQRGIDRDSVSALVKKYLEPTFQCDVRTLTTVAGVEHPVILVPPHGSSPICAKAAGPMVDGKSRGISQGVYYTRKPGPESAPVVNAGEWAPIIRRCAMHERSAIIAALDSALRMGTHAELLPVDTLKTFHDATEAAFVRALDQAKQLEQLGGRYWVLSYSVARADNENLEVPALPLILGEANREVEQFIKTGWSMFHIFGRAELAPYFNTDPASGLGESEFLECNLFREAPKFPGYDFWRLAPSGICTLVRPYWEDDPSNVEHTKRQPGTWLSPEILARSLAEFVMNARGLAQRFQSPTSIEFRCEWRGLSGRELWDPYRYWRPGNVARSNERTSTLTVPVASLADNWPAVVVQLAAPLVRVFSNDWSLTEARVSEWAGKWKNW